MANIKNICTFFLVESIRAVVCNSSSSNGGNKCCCNTRRDKKSINRFYSLVAAETVEVAKHFIGICEPLLFLFPRQML